MSKRPQTWMLAGRQYSAASSLLLAAPFLVLAFVVFLLPLAVLLYQSLFAPGLTTAHYQRALTEPVYMRVMWRTLKIALSVTVCTLLLAGPLAWVMARSAGTKLTILLAAILLPLWTSVLVRTYAWIVLLRTSGVINQLLLGSGMIDVPLKLLYTELAVIIAMSHVMLPFMVLPLYSTLRGIPEEYSRAAQMLGASAFTTFREIIFPLCLPGLTSGCLMVFLLAVGFYVTPELVGGPQQMMISTLISQQVLESLDWPMAGALVGVMLAFVLLITVVFKKAIRVDRMVGTT